MDVSRTTVVSDVVVVIDDVGEGEAVELVLLLSAVSGVIREDARRVGHCHGTGTPTRQPRCTSRTETLKDIKSKWTHVEVELIDVIFALPLILADAELLIELVPFPVAERDDVTDAEADVEALAEVGEAEMEVRADWQ